MFVAMFVAYVLAGFIPQFSEIIADVSGYNALSIEFFVVIATVSLITAVKRGRILGLIDKLTARTAAINNAAGLSTKAKAKAKLEKKKRTKLSEFTTDEIRNMSDEQYMKLRLDI